MTCSIVMAVYNGSKYILEQLDSIRHQSRMADEVIIIDDASADDSVRIIEDYIFKHKLEPTWKLIKNERNIGYIRAFHKGLSYAAGDIIFLCDQDDVWGKDKIKISLEYMEKNERILLLATTFSGIDENSKKIAVRSPRFTENHGLIFFVKYKKGRIYKISERKIAERNISMGCTMAIRKELANEYVKRDNKYENQVPHDWELCIRAAMKSGLYFLNQELIQYRIHNDNTIGVKKTDSEITSAYRACEYRNYCRYYKGILDWIPQTKRRLRKRLYLWESFYRERAEALENENPAKLTGLMFRYILKLGIHSILILNDLRALK